MPLGIEHNNSAGDIRAAAALVDLMELEDSETLDLGWDSDFDAYVAKHPHTGVYWYVVEQWQAREYPPLRPALATAHGWKIFDGHPYEEA
jgi:hypothetical protein